MDKFKKAENSKEIERSDIGIMRHIMRALFGRDNDELAVALIERFGDVSGVFRATRDELEEIKGMTDRTALFFSVALPVHRRALLQELIGMRAESEDMLVKLAAIYFLTESRAYDVCVLIDENGKVKRFEDIFNKTDIKEIVGAACKYNAERVAWFSFEPDSSPEQTKYSHRQIQLFKDLLFVLKTVGMEFVDYIEYYPYAFRSLRAVLHGDQDIKSSLDTSEIPYDRNEDLMSLLENYK